MADIAIFLTSTDQIRSALGLDIDDVPDVMLTDGNMAEEMEIELADVYANYEGSVSEAIETRLKLWCMYWGALQVVTVKRLAIMERIQANQDQLQRPKIDWDRLEEILKGKLADQERVLDTPSYTTLSPIARAVPDYNPITG